VVKINRHKRLAKAMSRLRVVVHNRSDNSIAATASPRPNGQFRLRLEPGNYKAFVALVPNAATSLSVRSKATKFVVRRTGKNFLALTARVRRK